MGLEWVGSSRIDDLVIATLGSHKGTLMVLASVEERPTAESLERYALSGDRRLRSHPHGHRQEGPLPRRPFNRGAAPGLSSRPPLAAMPCGNIPALMDKGRLAMLTPRLRLARP